MENTKFVVRYTYEMATIYTLVLVVVYALNRSSNFPLTYRTPFADWDDLKQLLVVHHLWLAGCLEFVSFWRQDKKLKAPYHILSDLVTSLGRTSNVTFKVRVTIFAQGQSSTLIRLGAWRLQTVKYRQRHAQTEKKSWIVDCSVRAETVTGSSYL